MLASLFGSITAGDDDRDDEELIFDVEIFERFGDVGSIWYRVVSMLGLISK